MAANVDLVNLLWLRRNFRKSNHPEKQTADNSVHNYHVAEKPCLAVWSIHFGCDCRHIWKTEDVIAQERVSNVTMLHLDIIGWSMTHFTINIFLHVWDPVCWLPSVNQMFNFQWTFPSTASMQCFQTWGSVIRTQLIAVTDWSSFQTLVLHRLPSFYVSFCLRLVRHIIITPLCWGVSHSVACGDRRKGCGSNTVR